MARQLPLTVIPVHTGIHVDAFGFREPTTRMPSEDVNA